jgi:DHA1 family tetracycline resistance protein-like MFS transporter
MPAVVVDESARDAEPKPRSCCGTYWPAIRAALFVFLTVGSYVITFPPLVLIKKRYFGSDRQAALAQSLFDGGGALVNLWVTTLYGRLLDAYGRRPFFLAASATTLLAVTSLALFPATPLVFMSVQRLSGLVQGSYLHAHITDIAPDPLVRTKYLGLLMVGFYGAFLLAIPSVVVPEDSAEYLFVTAAVLAAVAVLYAYWFIPETLSTSLRVPVRMAGAFNPFHGVSLLWENKMLQYATCAVVLITLVDAGASEVNLFYLNDRLGIGQREMALTMLEMGLLNPLAVGLLLPLALDRVAAPSIVICSAFANFFLFVVLMFIWATWPIYVFVIPGFCVASMVIPIVQGLAAKSGSSADAARRLAALQSVVGAGQVVGPISFGLLYSWSPDEFRGLPYLFGAVSCAIATFFAARSSRVERMFAAQAENAQLARTKSPVVCGSHVDTDHISLREVSPPGSPTA